MTEARRPETSITQLTVPQSRTGRGAIITELDTAEDTHDSRVASGKLVGEIEASAIQSDRRVVVGRIVAALAEGEDEVDVLAA